MTGMPVEEAVSGFIDDLLGNRSVIALRSAEGRVVDAWVEDTPEGDENVVYWYWGRQLRPLDGLAIRKR